MLIDPLGDDPIVITGSANFSDASTTDNDENMLVIRGDTRVADVYVGEFMRLWWHHNFRYIVTTVDAGSGEPVHNYLRPDDGWAPNFYEARMVKMKRRLSFA
jgi:phosphatidylserine/phosphatidylglycerophosphate/cardiolipin synthase-like enzyme